MSTSTPSLFLLPTELVMEVVESLDAKTLLACRATCHKLWAIAHCVLQRYVAALAANGLQDDIANRSSVCDRLAGIGMYAAAWARSGGDRRLECVSAMTTEPHPLWVSALAQGFWAHSKGPETTSLVVRRLPVRVLGVEEERWDVDLGFNVATMVMDPAQDLLLALQKSSVTSLGGNTFHILSLRTGRPHPLASTSRFQAESHQSFRRLCNIYGDYICIYKFMLRERSMGAGEIMVINWKTGEIEMSLPIPDCTSDACFLDDRYIIYIPTGTSTPTLMVYPFRSLQRNAQSHPMARYSLHLPPLHANITLRSAVSRTEAPFPPSRLAPISTTATSTRQVDDWLLSFNMECKDEEPWADADQYRHFKLFVSSTLSSYLDELFSSPENIQRLSTGIPWEEWAPAHARLMVPNLSSFNFFSRPASMRVADWDQSTMHDPSRERRITVYDFHSARVSPLLENPSGGEGASLETLFAAPVTVGMPFVERRFVIPEDDENEVSPDQRSVPVSVSVTEDGLFVQFNRSIERQWRCYSFPEKDCSQKI
ncbi:hypothetical protein OF83DRAFT_785773 [Amylostereum chailletii]|nr:hypothetical protein OF83DRAFT_785773 [Amylostereum chailletii]